MHLIILENFFATIRVLHFAAYKYLFIYLWLFNNFLVVKAIICKLFLIDVAF
jgi:hypothetical protein